MQVGDMMIKWILALVLGLPPTGPVEAPLPERAAAHPGDDDLVAALLETSDALRPGFKIAAAGPLAP